MEHGGVEADALDGGSDPGSEMSTTYEYPAVKERPLQMKEFEAAVIIVSNSLGSEEENFHGLDVIDGIVPNQGDDSSAKSEYDLFASFAEDVESSEKKVDEWLTDGRNCFEVSDFLKMVHIFTGDTLQVLMKTY